MPRLSQHSVRFTVPEYIEGYTHLRMDKNEPFGDYYSYDKKVLLILHLISSGEVWKIICVIRGCLRSSHTPRLAGDMAHKLVNYIFLRNNRDMGVYCKKIYMW